jgi:hypothetical protein
LVRRYTAFAAAVLCLAVSAPVARADHVAPTVTAALELGAKVRDCDSSQVCGGSRRATLSWNASCGPGVPDQALEEVEVSILGLTPGGRRFTYDSETFDSVSVGLVDSVGMTAGPGLRFLGEVVVTCSVQMESADGELVDHRGSARATTEEAYLPPRLGGFTIPRGTWCGVNLHGNQTSRLLQAGQYFDLTWFLRFSGESLIKRSKPGLRQIKLFGHGAGLTFRRSPDRAMLRDGEGLGTFVRPRRAGKLRIWATVGGKKTNTMRVRVLPKRC